MKKTKREAKKAEHAQSAPRRGLLWWAALQAAIVLAFEIYGPALNGPFVLDDRNLPYFAVHMSDRLSDWVGLLRPVLMFSYWIDYRLAGGSDPFVFHATNVAFHCATSVVAALVIARLLEWAGVEGRLRWTLAVFSGALFLAHPIQTESVDYVASRSEVLSVLFYYSAFAVFIYRKTEGITLARSLAVLTLFAAAVGTKEHTLTLPALLLLTDYFWGRGGVIKNRILYGLMAVGAAVGLKMVWNLIRSEPTAGFHVAGLTPFTYLLTQCRVIWTYVRLFLLPFGQNIDPDVAVSRGLLDHGAIFGALALIAAIAAAWIYRKRFPLASFGTLVFLLLLAPTSSIVPIRDVLAERRVYLPMIGLLLILCEFLRRLTYRRVAQIGAVAIALCSFLTFARSKVWAAPLALWTDAVQKSPAKYRPRFQLAFAQFESGKCQDASQSYEAASRMQPPDNELLVDWGLALDCANRTDEALAKLKQALVFKETAHIHTQIGRLYMRQQKWQEALAELADAQRLDPNYDVTYLYRGNIYQIAGDRQAAAREFQRALALNPQNEIARNALAQLGR